MRTRALTLVALMLLMLAAAPQFEAMPTGIGAAGDNGCTCHGGASGDTSVIVEGLPERFNASETYPFTVTVVNDVMELHNGGSTEGADPWNGNAAGFRILTSAGMVSTVNESLSHDMDGGLTHTIEGASARSWDFEWVAPADDGKVVEITVYGNAVNGGAGSGGDYWNEVDIVIPGAAAGAVAPSASALVIFLTSIGLAAGLIFMGILWVFYRRSPETFTMERFADFLGALDAIDEGDGTLLDNCLILGCSETSEGRTHSLDEIPILIAGGGCDRIVSGYHYRSHTQENASKVILSLLRAMDLPLSSWGSEDAQTSDGLTDIEL